MKTHLAKFFVKRNNRVVIKEFAELADLSLTALKKKSRTELDRTGTY